MYLIYVETETQRERERGEFRSLTNEIARIKKRMITMYRRRGKDLLEKNEMKKNKNRNYIGQRVTRVSWTKRPELAVKKTAYAGCPWRLQN